jgi:hypothetical protein
VVARSDPRRPGRRAREEARRAAGAAPGPGREGPGSGRRPRDRRPPRGPGARRGRDDRRGRHRVLRRDPARAARPARAQVGPGEGQDPLRAGDAGRLRPGSPHPGDTRGARGASAEGVVRGSEGRADGARPRHPGRGTGHARFPVGLPGAGRGRLRRLPRARRRRGDGGAADLRGPGRVRPRPRGRDARRPARLPGPEVPDPRGAHAGDVADGRPGHRGARGGVSGGHEARRRTRRPAPPPREGLQRDRAPEDLLEAAPAAGEPAAAGEARGKELPRGAHPARPRRRPRLPVVRSRRLTRSGAPRWGRGWRPSRPATARRRGQPRRRWRRRSSPRSSGRRRERARRC